MKRVTGVPWGHVGARNRRSWHADPGVVVVMHLGGHLARERRSGLRRGGHRAAGSTAGGYEREHAVELFARTTTPLVASWGQSWLSNGRIDLRFRRPVYDREELLVDVNDGRLMVTGPDGEVRCLGSADYTARRPDLAGFADASAAAEPVVDPVAGPFGSLHEACAVEENEWYLDAIGEPLPLYREKGWAHPGLLLRLVNKLLSSNVALGPWIHTSSDCHFLGVAQLPAQMTVHGRVTDVGRRGRHDEVRYDALVLAGAEPVVHVHHTALYRLAAAG